VKPTDAKSIFQVLQERYASSEIFVETLPALAFFAVNFLTDLRTATLVTLIVTPVAIVLGYLINCRLPWIAIVSAAVMSVLGLSSLLFDNELFIKISPTIGNGLFALTLLLGWFSNPSFLQRALGRMVSLTPHGWKVLTFSWIVFALIWAGTNELVWRWLSTDAWVTYKTFNDLPMLVGYVAVTRFVARRFWEVANN
jgi:intracellular septation protein